jgi:hypothetical protein
MDEQGYAMAAKLLAYCAGDDLFIGFVEEHADSRRKEASPGRGLQGKADGQPPAAAEAAAHNGEDQAIALPHGQVTAAVEEGQRFATSSQAAEPNTPNN